MTRALCPLFAVLALAGCASTPVVVRTVCMIPAALDYEAKPAAKLEAKDLKQHFVEEKLQRHEHDKLADDYNTLRRHVQDQCQ